MEDRFLYILFKQKFPYKVTNTLSMLIEKNKSFIFNSKNCLHHLSIYQQIQTIRNNIMRNV